jgi:hypothetical protein
MRPSNGKLIAMMRELAKKKVRKSSVGPWGWESSDDPLTLDEFIDEVEKILEAEDKPKMIKHTKYGDLFPATEFDGFMSDDGSGVWATENLQSNVSVWEDKPDWATHVMWYNK